VPPPSVAATTEVPAASWSVDDDEPVTRGPA
jgi:hypothetical protein